MVFFHFVVSTMKLHALAGRSKKEQVVVNGEVRCATCKDCHPNSTPPYLHISPPGTWSHLTPTTPHSLSHLELGACQGQSCNCSLVVECPPHPTVSSAQPWASFTSDWPIMLTPSSPMVWHICTKWLVFVYLSMYQGVLLREKRRPWGTKARRWTHR